MSAPNEPKKRAPAPRSKKSRILAFLRDGYSLNRFEAAAHGDSVLNSTISDLRADGQHILDEWEMVPNRWGSLARVKRYRYARLAK
jgi:hypothetical protein